ncbi:NAC transcription factor 29-like [Senna tora]|uniref:NAC transcription factor 29-like n=1 Tax=Senna tora TaxID=362788 RepID=A0A834X2R5_9FABA|nr:NAC transcription factor 29-like [Senna tora]
MDAPEGYRFVPSDGELVSHCLVNKLLNREEPIHRDIIREVDVYRFDPNLLPLYERRWSSEKEEYYFTTVDPAVVRRIPDEASLITIRRTQNGYWKEHGESELVTRGQNIVGFKRNLVYYIGSPPNGVQTKWSLCECWLLPSGLPERYRNRPQLLDRRLAVVRLRKRKFFVDDLPAAAQYRHEDEFGEYEPKVNWHREN